MKQKELVARLDQERIVDAITRAERHTSGEIRVHIQPHARGDVLQVAERTFERLGMTKTELRNGVLLFIASEEQSFAIAGDKGIHEKVGPDFWKGIAEHLGKDFRQQMFTEGIICAVDRIALRLAEFFPLKEGDLNELTNEISIIHGD
jgi:uncharacterized membrane protein